MPLLATLMVGLKSVFLLIKEWGEAQWGGDLGRWSEVSYNRGIPGHFFVGDKKTAEVDSGMF